MTSASVFRNPSLGSQIYLCADSDPLSSQAAAVDRVAFNSDKLLGEIDRLFNDSDEELLLPSQTFFGFTVGRFHKLSSEASKLARRHTFQSLSPSSEWFKLSPKSKLQRKLKKSSKFQRNRSDTFLLHEGLCTLQKLPQLACLKSKRRLSSCTRTPVDQVQRQLFTPDSGYGSSIEHLADPYDLTPRIPKRHVIGAYVSCGKLDVISELVGVVPELVAGILVHLSDSELLSFAQVSRTWNDVISSEARENERRVTYLRRKRNAYFAKKENAHNGSILRSRTLTQTTTLFGDIQPKATMTPGRRNLRSMTSGQSSSKHEEFWQSKYSLQPGAVQTKCRCGSPAPVNSTTNRARCRNCKFDFCASCRNDYHGNTPCRTPSRVRGDGVLTPKSRRNLRRL